jgi:hypothetical protein
LEQRIALHAGGDFLFGGGVGEEVAGELFGDELMEGFVGIEGVDDVFAVFPDLAGLVAGAAVGVGIADLVEPVAAPAFAVVGGI